MSLSSLDLWHFLLLVELLHSLSFFHFITKGAMIGTMSVVVVVNTNTTQTVVLLLAWLLGWLVSCVSVLSSFWLSGWITFSLPIKDSLSS